MEQATRTIDQKGDVVTLIKVTEVAEIPRLPRNTTLVGSAYEFAPSGITFDRSIRLTLGYDVQQLPNRVESIAMAYYSPGSGWVELEAEGGVVAGIGELTAPVNHFTIFAVVAKLTDASFAVANLTITPSEEVFWPMLTFVIRSGREVLVSAEVTNNGGQPGTHTAVLMINGLAAAEKDVTLEAGESQTVILRVVDNELGQYTVQLGDLTGEFEASIWINWLLIAVIILLLITAGWFIRRRVKRTT